MKNLLIVISIICVNSLNAQKNAFIYIDASSRQAEQKNE